MGDTDHSFPRVANNGFLIPLSLWIISFQLILRLTTANNLAYSDDKFVHILSGVVKCKSGANAHLIAQSTKGGLRTVVTGAHGDALLVQ